MSIQPWISVRHAALSELTLVILTYNRPEMVQRLLRYLRSHASEVALVLLDHGDVESQENNAAAIASLFPEVKHLRLPLETEWAEVLAKGVLEVKTRFSAFCPDDDIPVIDGMIDAVSMLIVNQQMVCAQGYVLSLTETESAICFGPIEDYVPSYDGDTPLKRLFNMMRRYQPVFFAFYRTEVLEWVVNQISAVKISNLNLMFQEFFYAALVCTKGAIGRSASISLWRRVTGSHTDRRTIHPYHQLIDNPGGLAADYLEFREQLIPYYLDDAIPDFSAQEAGIRRVFDLVYLQFLVRHINYAELEAKICQLLEDPEHDYFSGLCAQESNFDSRNCAAVPEFQDSNVLIDIGVLKDAAQVTEELLQGSVNVGREKKISTDMLMDAVRLALDYRSA